MQVSLKAISYPNEIHQQMQVSGLEQSVTLGL